MNRLRTVELYRDDVRKVVAIEAVELNQGKFRSCGQLFGAVTPLAVVVCAADGNAVMVVDADKNGLDDLRQRHPELDDLIARL